MQSVSQFYQHDPDIFGHRQKNFAQVFQLDFFFVAPQFEFSKFRDAVDKLCDFAAIHLPLKVGSDIALLNAIMYVLIKEDLYDRRFVESCTTGFDELKQKIMDY